MLDFVTIFSKLEIRHRGVLEEYIQFCLERKTESLDTYCENHHILPSCEYPEYASNLENIVRLEYDDHLKAHELLSIAIDNGKLLYAFSMMSFNKTGDREALANSFRGDNNPSKRAVVRNKISKAKSSKPRPDMLGKNYFGASPQRVEEGIAIMMEKKAGMCSYKNIITREIVYMATDDARLGSREWVGNVGISSGDSNAMRNPKNVDKFKAGIAKRAEEFSNKTAEEIVSHCVNALKSGTKVIKENGKLDGNYVRLFNYAGIPHEPLLRYINLSWTGRFND